MKNICLERHYGLEINLDQIRANIKELNSSTNILRLEKKLKGN